MKQAFLKTAFIAIVFVFTIAFLTPATFLLDAVIPRWHDAEGRLRTMDSLLPGIVVMFACLMAANRITSFLFWSAHHPDERWSVFETRRSRRET